MTHLWIMLACMTVFFHLATQIPVPQGGDNQKAADSSKTPSTTEKRGFFQTIAHYYDVTINCLKSLLKKVGEIFHIGSSKSSSNSAKSSSDSEKKPETKSATA